MTPERDHRLLKNLSHKFVASNDPDIFIGIAVLVDKLLFYTIHRARRAKPYLRKVDINDLYQDAILGLYAALRSIKEDEPGSKIVYRIVRYVNNELVKQYRRIRRGRVVFPFDVGLVAFQVHLYASDMVRSAAFIRQIEDKLSTNTPVYANLELEIVEEKYKLLIKEGVISQDEFVMITMKYVDGLPGRVIAKHFGVTIATVLRKIENALNRLRYEFRVRGWEVEL